MAVYFLPGNSFATWWWSINLINLHLLINFEIKFIFSKIVYPEMIFLLKNINYIKKNIMITVFLTMKDESKVLRCNVLIRFFSEFDTFKKNCDLNNRNFMENSKYKEMCGKWWEFFFSTKVSFEITKKKKKYFTTNEEKVQTVNAILQLEEDVHKDP